MIYKKNHKRIFDFLYKFTNNEEVALDLMQETFLSYYKYYSKDEFSLDKSLMILYTIARNNSINYSKKFSTKNENPYEKIEYKSDSLSIEKNYELKDMEEKLYSHLSTLPEEQKTAVILKSMEDMTLQQISEIMDISISTASRLVTKGLANLVEYAKENGMSL
ncbi:MAG: sigma-70 family RNA polymerase sigma factor [Leptospiraceae bacterium]|nr:sigma-70 family RNA polymerase sigma factor [Leptospiraceae bacterium]